MPNTHSTLTSLFSDIANSIRAKTGSNGTIVADEFPDAIDDIQTGVTPTGSISITENGTHDVTDKASAVVNVPNPSTGSLSITANGTYDVTEKASAVVNIASSNIDYMNLIQRVATQYIIPEGVTKIGEHTFACFFNSGLSVVLPSTLTEICYEAFLHARGLTAITIPSNVTKIYGYAFCWCSNLASITLNEGLTEIQSSAFENCSSMALSELPSTVTTLGERVFYYCTNVTINRLPAGVTNYNKNYFYRCGMTEFYFPSGISTIKSNFIYDCPNVTNIYVPWAENEVAGAPWGATNAEITYNYTGE